MKVRNIGRTEAWAVQIATKLKLGTSFPDRREREFTSTDFKDAYPSFLFSFDYNKDTSSLLTNMDRSVYPREYDGLKAQKAMLLIWGEIRWTDSHDKAMPARPFCRWVFVEKVLNTDSGDDPSKMHGYPTTSADTYEKCD